MRESPTPLHSNVSLVNSQNVLSEEPFTAEDDQYCGDWPSPAIMTLSLCLCSVLLMYALLKQRDRQQSPYFVNENEVGIVTRGILPL